MRLDHRPWPPPAAPWIMGQRWHDLMFAHWRLPPERLRPLIPAGLELDLCDGAAWIGVVPFRMSGVRPRGVPGLPWISAFPELNVRTYVTRDGKPGVWFLSLDAARMPAVIAARTAFHLPYFWADMRCTPEAEGIVYSSRRTHPGAKPAEFRARYGPAGASVAAEAGSLEHWLTERYCLYAANARGGIYRCEINHDPWPLAPGWMEIDENSMTRPFGIELPEEPPLLHFSRFQDVVVWMPKRVG